MPYDNSILLAEVHETVLRLFAAKHTPGSPDDCWEWQGEITRRGYGRVGNHAHRMSAHRLALLLVINELPADMLVCHRCDNRKCVNPGHLFLGSAKENTADMMRKGRKPMGVASHNAKLTEEDVAFIRKNFKSRDRQFSQHALARRFGVGQTTIRRILAGTSWRP
jgi:hypothetical protein